MKTLKIDSCSFGRLVIDGKAYTDDLIIHPDGKILGPWWRRRGHQLSWDDLTDLIDAAPEVIVAGTGVSGMVKPDKDLEKKMSYLSIEFIAAPNQEAIATFNELVSKKRVGACFHLTC
jgi:hypothetical protein